MAAQPPIPASLWNTIAPEAQAAILAHIASLEQRIADLEAENADLRRRLAQVEHQLQSIRQRGKRASHRRDEPPSPRADRRRKEHRRHPGCFRSEPPPGTAFIEHDVRPQRCSHCGACDLQSTGQFEDHFVADLPEPKLEWHRYRRHIYRCRTCQRTCQGRGDLELPGSHIGPCARLLTCYSRAHLGISLGKTRDLLHDFFGLTISRAGLLGHLRRGGRTLRPGGRRTPGDAPPIPRGPGGRDRLADRRPTRLGLVLPRPPLGLVPHRSPPQSRCPHPSAGRIVRRHLGQRLLRGVQRPGLRQAALPGPLAPRVGQARARSSPGNRCGRSFNR